MTKNRKYIILIIFLLIINFDIKFFQKIKMNSEMNFIHIAMSLNNNYIYPIIVSITSILINSNKNTFINFHILIGNDVEFGNKNKILSLKILNDNSNFSFHNVGDNFRGWIHGKKKLTVASFYRSILGELLKDVDKIIYLDGDTLIYGDLVEMYKLNMSNLYFRGIRELIPNGYLDEIDKTRFICAGVMLMNLKLIRENNVYNIFKNYYYQFYKKQIYFGDQYIINVLFKNKIDFLPPKFGIWFMTNEYLKQYEKLKPIIYTTKELKKANERPVIRHLWGTTKEGLFLEEKPWLFNRTCKVKEEWKYYAKKSGYYSSICLSFKNACKD